MPYPSTYSEEQASAVRMALDKAMQRQMDLATFGLAVLAVLRDAEPVIGLDDHEARIARSGYFLGLYQHAVNLGLCGCDEEEN